MRTTRTTRLKTEAPKRSRRLAVAGAVLTSLALAACGTTTPTPRAGSTGHVETARAKDSASKAVKLPNLNDPVVRARFAKSFADGFFAP